MSQLNGMRYVLERLRVKVRQKQLELIAKGTTPQAGDMKTPAFWADLQKFADQLQLMVRNLGSMASGLEAEAEGARFAPLSYRYSAKQSVRDRQRNVSNVVELAEEIAADLRELYGKGQAPTEADMVKGVEKLLKEIGKSVDQTTVHAVIRQLTDQPSLHSVDAAPISFASLSALPVMVMAIILLIRRKARERENT